ncbi:phytanoyl-CoA dioxygenase family protein [Gordonia sp. OPL2]|uniref:phytanoyl-CoA dioxygenase family protein n=1 Tax=Gordonia sp. OPL2 TaxID=2486274 RepID=UPI0016565F48|nr:phytanoyl-CoA dioxygenase family protein [Gordonia sp. OPL2]ROZ99355.1 phytanoyl-CoA dioxygenase family protein [Gordonia sp. OPL2]
MTSVDTTIQRLPSTTPAADILAIVARDGGVIIEGLLSQDQVARFNTEIDPAVAALAAGSTHENEIVQEFHGANTKRLTNLVNHSDVFREEIIDLDLVHDLCDARFLEESGTYWMTTAQVIEIGPGNRPQMLHRDLENWYPFVGMGPAGPEITLNFLIALTEFTEENGATRVIPGSHLWPDFEDRGTPEQTIPATMKAGDALFISGKTVHGGGANVTADQYRRAVSFAFNPGYLVGEEAYPFLVSRDVAATLPERVQRILGFRSQYPLGSPGLWQVDYAELADYLGL